MTLFFLKNLGFAGGSATVVPAEPDRRGTMLSARHVRRRRKRR